MIDCTCIYFNERLHHCLIFSKKPWNTPKHHNSHWKPTLRKDLIFLNPSPSVGSSSPPGADYKFKEGLSLLWSRKRPQPCWSIRKKKNQSPPRSLKVLWSVHPIPCKRSSEDKMKRGASINIRLPWNTGCWHYVEFKVFTVDQYKSTTCYTWAKW